MDSYETKEQLARLSRGEAPGSGELLKRISVGAGFLTDFLSRQYFDEYIPAGGSKLKFVTGRPGSGKTHVSQLLEMDAREKGFLTVRFSAREIWLHDFREIYLEILRQCGIERVMEGCAQKIIREMGYDPEKISDGMRFLDYLSTIGEADALSKNAIRSELRHMFKQNPRLDNNFAFAASLLTGEILGHPVLEDNTKQLLTAFLSGDKSIKLSQLRAIGMTPSRITKYNARHMLRSLAEVIHESGYAGLFVVIDDMEALLERASSEKIRYTKLRRDDAYESIRQLIDDIDSMRYILFCMCFDRRLIDDESYGIKSYQALWMRIQNEVTGARFNRFADMIDLDRLGDQVYTEDVLTDMGSRLADALSEGGYSVQYPGREEISQLEEKSHYGGLGLPYLLNRCVAGGNENV